jgi:ankyrin repeat protein
MKQSHYLLALVLLFGGSIALAGQDKAFQDEFIQAISNGADVDRVAEMLRQGADASLRDQHGLTPLIAATMRGKPEVIRLLLNQGADVNAMDGGGRMPLGWAAGAGNMEAVRLMLDSGAEVNATDFYERTALVLAVQGRHTEIVNLLKAHGADDYALTLNLMDAVVNNDFETTQAILDYGLNANVKTPHGTSHTNFRMSGCAVNPWAIREGINQLRTAPKDESVIIFAYTPRMFQLLLDHGADINTRDTNGDTALTITAAYGDPEVTRFLLEHGVNRTIKNFKGQTALDIAKQSDREHSKEVVKLLEAKS